MVNGCPRPELDRADRDIEKYRQAFVALPTHQFDYLIPGGVPVRN
jgi:hypothetical protein